MRFAPALAVLRPVLLALFATASLVTAEPSAGQPTWRIPPGRMTTSWGDQVTPANAWREYPRPQFVRAAWDNLNGLWEYAVTPRTAAAPTDYQGRILVPFAIESALSGVARAFTPDDRLWYRRAWTVPAAWRDQRVLLHFGAVDYACTLWVNGGLVGSHVGGNDAFTFDVTAFLRDGANEIVLGVTDPTDTGEQPRGKQMLKPHGIWYTPVSGIWQTVWAEPVPKEMHLAELRCTPDVENSRLRVTALTDAAYQDNALAVRFTASTQGRVVATTVVRINREGWLDLPQPRLWSPEDPFLYDLKAELIRVKSPHRPAGKEGEGKPVLPAFGASERVAYAKAEVLPGEPLDVVTSYFGLRQLSLGAGPKLGQPHLRLNGQAIFQHGPLDQGWWPDGLLTPPSDAAMVWELEWLKRAGFNMLRKHIKVEPARYYYHCDRLGLLVWQDMPSGYNRGLSNAPWDEGEPPRLSDGRAQHELELRRMVGALYNHPAIVMWVIHNEGWGQYETPALTAWVKAIDPSRWCNATTGWRDENRGDVYDIHTYQEDVRAPVNKEDRAIVVGEYGGVGWPVADHLWDATKRNWGYQTYHDQPTYVAQVSKRMAAIEKQCREIGLSAAVYTQTSDVEGEVNGLLTYDRRVEKMPPETLAEINRRLVKKGLKD